MSSGCATCFLGEVPVVDEPPQHKNLCEVIVEQGDKRYWSGAAGAAEWAKEDRPPVLEPWLKRFRHTKVVIHLLDFAPPTEPCPECGETAKRHQVVDRGPIMDASLDGPILLMIKLGIYLCRSKTCTGAGKRGGRWRSFRKSLPIALPRGRYTLRARELGINGVKLDGLPFSKVVQRLARDFHMSPARSTAWEWHKSIGDQAASEIDLQKWSVESLSGVVCIDEMYQGEFCLLVATDPLNKLTLGFQLLTGKIDRSQMAEFMRYLKHKGISPDVLVTDESTLYPPNLEMVWPKAKHQLCIFHILQHVTKHVLASVREFLKTMPTDPKLPTGRPRKGSVPASTENSQARKNLYDARYLFVKNPDNLTEEAKAKLQELLQRSPGVETARLFMLDVFALLSSSTTMEQAHVQRDAMVATAAYQADSNLKKALKKFEDDTQFEKMLTYTHYTNLNRTNNDVERRNRWIRKKQKSHYNLRTADSIRNAMALQMKTEQNGRDTLIAPKLTARG